MKQKAIDILQDNRLMAISTLRPDGWPQATMVSYANEDILLYFVVSKKSQKFANIERDDRVSLVIGHDFHDPSTIKRCRLPRARTRSAIRSSGSAPSSCCLNGIRDSRGWRSPSPATRR